MTGLDSGGQPLVSCVMPTRGRPAFVSLAIESFRRQTYTNRELLIVADSDADLEGVDVHDARIRVLRTPRAMTLGSKRNWCVESCRGDLILHWDDDDWMAPGRIEAQVRALLAAGADVSGMRRLLFHALAAAQTWIYEYPRGRQPWLAGGTLLFTRDFWRKAPFPDIQVGSDTRFILTRRPGKMKDVDALDLYVAMVHDRHTSPKRFVGACWSRWNGDISSIVGGDLPLYREAAGRRPRAARPAPRNGGGEAGRPPGMARVAASGAKEPVAILMVAHNALDMTRMSTLRSLRHSGDWPSRLYVVDNASSDGTERWLRVLAERGDIELIRSERNIGHAPGLELARSRSREPLIVTLDSDAFPLCDGWIGRLRERLRGRVKAAGILHWRGFVHPSCMMIERRTLDEHKLTFHHEWQTNRLDVGERISLELRRLGFELSGLERTRGFCRAGSEPTYLGSEYEGLVHHHWYTTRVLTTPGGQVDDVPPEDVARSLEAVSAPYRCGPRDVTVLTTVRAGPGQPLRRANAIAVIKALNAQSLSRWRYRIVVVEQDTDPGLRTELRPYSDEYIFAYNPGPHNRSWGLNVAALSPGAGTGALCIVDADILLPQDALDRGLEALASGAGAVLPHDRVCYLTPEASQRALREGAAAFAGALSATDGLIHRNATGGSIWVTPGLYHAVGGHDERFEGWGAEDDEFWRRVVRHGRAVRRPGVLLHLHHEPQPKQDARARANQVLYRRILAEQAGAGPREIGRVDRYADRKAPPPPPARFTAPPRRSTAAKREGTAAAPAGARDWESWHRWSDANVAAILDQERARPETTSQRGALARLLVPLGPRILDVGCAAGALGWRIQSMSLPLAWHGLDVTERMLRAARRGMPQAPLIRGDACNLPFAAGAFDAVVLRHLLEHLPPSLMADSLIEAARVAGRAVVAVLHRPVRTKGARSIRRTAGGFIVADWLAEDLLAPVRWSRGWRCERRLTLNADRSASDDVWIFTGGQ